MGNKWIKVKAIELRICIAADVIILSLTLTDPVSRSKILFSMYVTELTLNSTLCEIQNAMNNTLNIRQTTPS